MPPPYSLLSSLNGTSLPPGNGTDLDKLSINSANGRDVRFIVVMSIFAAALLLFLAASASNKISKLRARENTMTIAPSQTHALLAPAQLLDPRPSRNCLAAMAKRWHDKFKIRPFPQHRGSFMRDAFRRRARRQRHLSDPNADDTSVYAPNRKLISHSETGSLAASTTSLGLAPLSGPDQISPPPRAYGSPPRRSSESYRYGGYSVA